MFFEEKKEITMRATTVMRWASKGPSTSEVSDMINRAAKRASLPNVEERGKLMLEEMNVKVAKQRKWSENISLSVAAIVAATAIRGYRKQKKEREEVTAELAEMDEQRGTAVARLAAVQDRLLQEAELGVQTVISSSSSMQAERLSEWMHSQFPEEEIVPPVAADGPNSG